MKQKGASIIGVFMSILLIIGAQPAMGKPIINEALVLYDGFGRPETVRIEGQDFGTEPVIEIGNYATPLAIAATECSTDPPAAPVQCLEAYLPDDIGSGDYQLSITNPSEFLSCDDGKPSVLLFEYTGAECAESTNPQDGKADCSDLDFIDLNAPVEIVLTKHESKIRVAPSTETIYTGDTVMFAAMDKKLKSSLEYEVRQAGRTLQSGEIHTSCSKPLTVGDQFGSLLLTEYFPEGYDPNEIVGMYDLTIAAVPEEVDPVFAASAASDISANDIAGWDMAYDWGNHAAAGYLTSYAETDPVFEANAAALEESAEIDADIATHTIVADAHHTKTASFSELTDAATDAQIPDDITIDRATTAGDADTVDGAHAAALEESAEIDADIATHTGVADAHHTKTASFSELTDAATDAQIPDNITIDRATTAGDADTVDGAHAAALEESAEIDADITAHAGVADAHHTKTTSFGELTDAASDAQIPDDITIDRAATAGDADTVDGAHAAALEESAEIDADIAAHAGVSDAHHTKTASFSELTDAATDAQIPDDITIDRAATAGDADTVDGAHAASLEESAEIDADIVAHAGVADAHHAKTVSFSELSDTASDAQIPDDITIDRAATAGDADTVDGAHAAALEESAEIDADIVAHAGVADAHHAKTVSFSELSDTASDAQIPDDITIDRAATAGDADTVDGAHAATLEESAEIDADIAAHSGVTDAHHAKTTSFGELTDAATDAQIPDNITIDRAATAGNADTVDGIHAAALEESAEIDADIAAHTGLANAHHTKTTTFAELTDRATDEQIPDDITIQEIDPQVGSNTTNQIPRWDGNALVDGTIYDNGNVGIGTTSPGHKLHVAGGLNKGNIRLDNQGAIIWGNGHGSFIDGVLKMNSDLSFQIRGNGIRFKNGGNNEVVRITNTGSIGIGTTNPSEKLEVTGTVKATAFEGDGSALTGILITEADPTVPASVKDGIDWVEVSNRPAGLDDGDDVGITSETDPTVPASVKDGISWSEVANKPAGFADGTDDGITSESDPTVLASVKDGVDWFEITNRPAGLDDGDQGGGITSETDPQVGAMNLNRVPRWSGASLVSGTIYDNGFLGIGTTSPDARLSVNGDVIVGYGSNSQLFVRDSTLDSKVVLRTNGNSYLNGGNVGIGTTSPDEKLSVDGNVIVGYGTDAELFVRDATLDSKAVLRANGNSYLNGGNVGIGITDPAAKLDVFSQSGNSSTQFGVARFNAESTADMTDGFGGGFQFLLSDNGTAPVMGAAMNWIRDGADDQAAIAFFGGPTGGRETLRISNSGNVGIGTTNPSHQLVVEDSGRVEFQLRTRDSAPVGIALFSSTGSSDIYIPTGTDELVLNNDGDHLTVTNNGRVGIGTRSPSYTLHVTGSVAGTSWTTLSSREYKENIRELREEEAIAALRKLQTSRYNYRPDMGGEEHVGFIAEEVPDIVATDDRKGVKAIDLIAVLTKVVQVQQKKIEELEARFNARQ